MTDLKKMQSQAADLDEVKLEANRRETAKKLAREQAEKRALEQAERYALAWAKAMRRAFKGIGPTHKQRVASMTRPSMFELARAEHEAA